MAFGNDMRRVDYSVAAHGFVFMHVHILCFVRGIRKQRKNPVSHKLVLKQFYRVPRDLVELALSNHCAVGFVRQVVGPRGAMGYEATQAMTDTRSASC